MNDSSGLGYKAGFFLGIMKHDMSDQHARKTLAGSITHTRNHLDKMGRIAFNRGYRIGQKYRVIMK